MKKFSKILSLVLVLALVFAPIALAADGTISNPGSDFNANVNSTVQSNMKGPLGQVIGTLQWIGYGIALIMVVWLGIQWMIAQPAKKAELKGKMWSMAIGIILIVAGSTIVGMVWNGANTVTSNSATETAN